MARENGVLHKTLEAYMVSGLCLKQEGRTKWMSAQKGMQWRRAQICTLVVV